MGAFTGGMGSFEGCYEAIFPQESIITGGFSFADGSGRIVIVDGVRIVGIKKQRRGVPGRTSLIFISQGVTFLSGIRQ